MVKVYGEGGARFRKAVSSKAAKEAMIKERIPSPQEETGIETLGSPVPVNQAVDTGITPIVEPSPLETQNTGIVETPAIPKKAVSEKVILPPEAPNVVYHGTTTPEVPLSVKSMDSDIGIHFGTYGAAENRLKFKDGVIHDYELTNVKKVLQVQDIGGNHDAPKAVLPMLQASGGLTADQSTFLENSIPKRSDYPSTKKYFEANDTWLKQANRLLVDNGYTHLTYLNTAEGGQSWTALTDEGFKIKTGITEAEPTGIEEKIVKVAPITPPGTTNFKTLVDTGKLDKNVVADLLRQKAKMRWKGAKGLREKDQNWERQLDQVVSQAYPHLMNRNWNAKTVASLERWIDSAADAAVKVAINELSTPSGNAEMRKSVAELAKVMEDFQKTNNHEPSLKELVGEKDNPTELAKKWGPVKLVKVYYEKQASEMGISYDQMLEQGIEPTANPETGITEMQGGYGIPMPAVKIVLPSLSEMVTNSKDFLAYTKEGWNRIINPLRFYPELKNYPQLKNAIRVEFMGANIEAKAWIDKIYTGTFGKLDTKQQNTAVEILKLRSQLERIKKGRIAPISEEKCTELLNAAIKDADPETLLATEKWNALERAVQADLIERGKLDPEQAMEDHVAFFVDAYTKDWMLWSSIPRKLKKPFRGYLKFARGTTKEYRVDMDTLLASMYRVKMDNVLEDFVLKWLDKYDVLNDMTTDEQIAQFGETTSLFGKVRMPKSPKPNALYEINGKKYIGYQYEHFPRQLFKTEEGLIALGKLNKVYLIPQDLQPTFNNFKPASDPFMAPVMYQINRANSFFKSTAIFSIFPKYNVNNMVGDAFMLYLQSPKSFLKLDASLKFLTKRRKDYNPQDVEFEGFLKRQRVLSTFAEAELAHMGHNPLNLLAWSNRASEFREKILRTCLAMRLWGNLKAGNNLAPKFDWIPTEGLAPEDALGKISREVIVDYLSTSQSFNRYMKGFAIPFGTWFAKAGSLFANFIKKHPFKALGAMVTPVLAADIYNNTGDRKEIEQNLPDYVRNRTHVIIGKSKRPGKAWVNVLQLPIDVIPLFPLVNIATKNAFKVANGETKSLRQAGKDTLKETTSSSIRLGEFLLSPLYRFFSGVKSNKDPISGSEIVPREGKVGPEVWIKKMGVFAANTLIPPMSLALRAEKRVEYIEDEGLLPAAKRWFAEWWDPIKALGFNEVNLTGQDEDLLQAADQATRKYNNLMVRYAEDISTAKQREPQFYVELAKEAGLVKNDTDAQNFLAGLYEVIQNPKWMIANLLERERHTRDPQERMLIEGQVQWLQGKRREQMIKSTPKGARGDALRNALGE
jgi:hypothetical protein